MAFSNNNPQYPVINARKKADGSWDLNSITNETVTLTTDSDLTPLKTGQLAEVPAEANLDGSNAAPTATGLTLTTSTSPASGEFYVDYTNGTVITASDAGATISVTYSGKGTAIQADNLNQLEKNFASSSAPSNKPEGKIWCDNTSDPAVLKYYKDGSNNDEELTGLTLTQTLTNKTLTSPVLSGTVSGDHTLSGTQTRSATAIMNSGVGLDFSADSRGVFKGPMVIVWRMITDEPTGGETPMGGATTDWEISDDTENEHPLGYANATVTFTNGTDVVNHTNHRYNDGDLVYFTNDGGALPAELSASTNYYIVNGATNTYQVSATSGGSAIDFTDDGTGTHTAHYANVNNGNPVTQTNGVFSFAATGYYKVELFGSGVASNPDSTVALEIQSTDDNSTYTAIAKAESSAGGSGWHINMSCASVIKVTNTSNDKIRFSSSSTNVNFEGSTSENRTYAIFTKLADL